MSEEKTTPITESDFTSKKVGEEKNIKSDITPETEKDSDIDTMSIDELEKSNEKPRPTASEKMESAKEKKTAKKKKSKLAKFWKKSRGFIIFLILVIIGVVAFLMYKKKKTAEEAMANIPTQEFALVERQDITDPISTTGTIKAKKTSTLYSALKDTKITNVNYEVGDEVNEGDVLVTFSVENINKNIEETEEDIATSKQKEALEAESRERNYLYTYGSESATLASAEQKVESALKSLYEACDAYGDAKRELQAYIDGDPDTIARNPGDNAQGTLQQKVSTAYQQEQTAQQNYSDAVNSLAEANRKANNDLASADNTLASGNLTAGDNTKKLERTLETYQESLEDYVVTAPISGIVTKVEVEEGNGFNGGNLMVIQDDKHLVVTTEIDEYDIPTVAEGQRVVIKTDATGDDELEGTVSMVAPTATTAASGSGAQSSSSGVTYTVDIDVTTRDERLRIGMSAKINIITDSHTNTLVVPYSAINEEDDGTKYVNVVDASAKSSAPADSEESNNTNKSGIQVFGLGSGSGSSSKPSMPSGGNMPNGMPGMPGAGNSSGTNLANTRKVVVTTGIEGDYYTEVFSDELTEGMQVVLTQTNSSSNDFMDMMMNMGGGPGGGGGMGGGPGM